MKARSPRHVRRLTIVATIVALAVVVGLAAGYASRSRVAAFLAARALQAQGFDCDHVAASVPHGLIPSTIVLAPMRCTATRGSIASIRFAAPVYVHVHGLGVERIECADMAIDLRRFHRDVDLDTLGALGHVGGLDQPGIDLALDFGDMAAHPMPPVRAARAHVSRGGQPVAEMQHFALGPGRNGLRMTAGGIRVVNAAFLGWGSFDGVATPDRADVTIAYPHLHVGIIGTHLRAARPHVDFSVGLGDAPPARRAHPPRVSGAPRAF